jgi:hypothetical protein
VRGPAPVAQALYEETPRASPGAKSEAEQRRFAAEPSQSIEQGRPDQARPPQAGRLEPLERHRRPRADSAARGAHACAIPDHRAVDSRRGHWLIRNPPLESLDKTGPISPL